MNNKLARFIGTGFYSGYVPVASGTVGTFVAVFIYYVLKEIDFLKTADWSTYLLFLFWITVIGIWAADVLAKETKMKDPSIIVIDEIVGFFFAVAFLPPTTAYIIAAFILFRILDVLKPPPAKQSEDLPGGFGVMTDDIICGIATSLILHIIRILF